MTQQMNSEAHSPQEPIIITRSQGDIDAEAHVGSDEDFAKFMAGRDHGDTATRDLDEVQAYEQFDARLLDAETPVASVKVLGDRVMHEVDVVMSELDEHLAQVNAFPRSQGGNYPMNGIGGNYKNRGPF